MLIEFKIEKILLFTCCYFFLIPCFGQEPTDSINTETVLTVSEMPAAPKVRFAEQVYVSAIGGHLDMDSYGPRGYGGIEIDVQFHNGLGLQYRFLVGSKYFHMPAGAALGVLAAGSILESADSLTFGKGVIAVILSAAGVVLPEGISYTVQAHENVSIAPYLNPLQLEFIKRGDEKGIWYGGGSAGARINFHLNEGNLRLSAFYEVKAYYNPSTPITGNSWGFTLGSSF